MLNFAASTKKSGGRGIRLAEAIRELLAELLVSGRLGDPRLQQVVFTRAKITDDLQLASIYFRVYDLNAKEDAQKALSKASHIFRRYIGDELEIKRVPQLRFFFDESMEQLERIEGLLLSLKH